MKRIEKVTNLYGGWMPSDVAFIKFIEWSIKDLVIIFYCQPRNNTNGWPDISGNFFEVSLTFFNVSALRLEFTSNGLQQISGFDILDIASDGLEKINFHIEDYENGIIGFKCESIVLNSVSEYIKI